MPTVRIDVANLKQVQATLTNYPRRVKEEARSWARDVAYEERDLIRRNIHRRTGHTQQYGVQVFEQTQGEKGYFEIRLSQVVQWLESGTGIYGPLHHVIVPVHASVLKFTIGGVTLFRRWVKGMEAQAVVTRAVNEMAGLMPARIAALRQRLVSAWGKD